MTATQDTPAGLRRLERLVVTRPQPEAAVWVQALRARGWPAQALPLIEIAEPGSASEREGLRHWRAHWPQADAILFVSGAAVSHFFAGGVASPPPGNATRFWAPGPATARQLAQALAALGLETGRIDAPDSEASQFDSEHLWPQVSAQVGPGRQVLIVRGGSAGPPSPPAEGAAAPGVPGRGRDWLIRQCQAAGARVEGCAAYVRRWPQPTDADLALARQARGAGSVWLFSSSEALAPLQAWFPDGGWSAAGALVTHPRIATAALEAGFGQVVTTRPTLEDVLRSLESVGYRP
ncbi:uroporphyrinogen-III synthase [Hydrogenophaga sp.]|uniref:uroporphyrinogen-III synthase n=1 Tax=Hydrogenophaga sp. TaxID=1904254 RepID=UPI002622B7A6|nr:uroporphyrinogen-III synthase [Hydrogenophaga sp.]